ncbi:putative serine/threonine-protein phosphatase 4 regulatory subunit 2 [Blattamonas nauphoetae]|uniref:Serine/threonine-protein phosphatase 4 regulatory subunit 2 n=1 Tax=Blattamonas nauphoetae TaxID=2049346 RepID=A0ABQ9YF85_9EUKA|nr:putative serine/threonine-protein phosphatase 4 regulatory subunit 2 [Blattamonas nauphoetae]
MDDFIRAWISKDISSFPDQLQDLIVDISNTGRLTIDWPLVRAVLSVKLKHVVEDCFEKMKNNKGELDKEKTQEQETELIHQLLSFQTPPLTLQRLCELLVKGEKWYGNPTKYLKAIDKVLFISPYCGEELYDDELLESTNDPAQSGFQ